MGDDEDLFGAIQGWGPGRWSDGRLMMKPETRRTWDVRKWYRKGLPSVQL